MEQISKERENEILNMPSGQKRTSKHKKSVYIDFKYVYKGPYRKDEKSFLNNIYNTKKMLEKGIKSILPIEKILYCEDRYYIVWRYLGKPEEKDIYEQATTKLETDRKIIKRNTVILRASDCEDKLTDNDKKEIIEHLKARYDFGVGDCGLYNIIYDFEEKNWKGIDLEEDRPKREYKDEIEKCFSKPSKKNREMFKNFV